MYIIDLAKTLQQIRHAVEVIKSVTARNGSVLFVGTKKQAKSVVRELAEAAGVFYVGGAGEDYSAESCQHVD